MRARTRAMCQSNVSTRPRSLFFGEEVVCSVCGPGLLGACVVFEVVGEVGSVHVGELLLVSGGAGQFVCDGGVEVAGGDFRCASQQVCSLGEEMCEFGAQVVGGGGAWSPVAGGSGGHEVGSPFVVVGGSRVWSVSWCFIRWVAIGGVRRSR